MRGFPLVLLAMSMLPSLAWILLDQTVWPWDQSWYGFNSVTLYNSLTTSPHEWINDLIAACIAQPPAVAWIGQFFVPLASLTGSIDSALLLSIITTNYIALVLIYRSVHQLSMGRRMIALTATILVSSGPLFIALTHQYFAESIQLLVVSWFLLLLAKARSWPRHRMISHWILACFLAMAAKASSPLYCFLPAMTSMILCVQKTDTLEAGNKSQVRMHRLERAFLFAGLLIVPFLVIRWYHQNGKSMEDHVRVSALAEHWGARDSFLNKLATWNEGFQRHFFMHPVALFTSFVVAIACYVAIYRMAKRRRFCFSFFDLVAVISLLQILGPIMVFCIVANEEFRYLLPLAPYLAIIIAWSLSQIPKYWALTALFIYTCQLLLVHAEALALAPSQYNSIAWLIPVSNSSTISNQVNEIINITCPIDVSNQSTIIEVAADVRPLNNFSLNFRASTIRPGYLGLRSKPCDYINSIKLAKSLEPLIGSLTRKNLSHVVATESIRNVPSYLAPSFTNELTDAVSSQFLLEHGFVISSSVKDFLGTNILIFKVK